MDHLKDSRESGSGIHYPIPLHLQKAYRLAALPGWPISLSRSAWHALIVLLPMFPQLTAEQQERVVEAVMTFAEAATEQAA